MDVEITNDQLQEAFEANIEEIPESLRNSFYQKIQNLIDSVREQIELKRKIDPNFTADPDKEAKIAIRSWVKEVLFKFTYSRYQKLMEEQGEEPIHPKKFRSFNTSLNFVPYQFFRRAEREKLMPGAKITLEVQTYLKKIKYLLENLFQDLKATLVHDAPEILRTYVKYRDKMAKAPNQDKVFSILRDFKAFLDKEYRKIDKKKNIDNWAKKRLKSNLKTKQDIIQALLEVPDDRTVTIEMTPHCWLRLHKNGVALGKLYYDKDEFEVVA